MPAIFLSHSSDDDNIAVRLEEWLASLGFDDIFIDHSSIRGGDKWTEALRAATSACRVVLCLVTANWLSSDECFGEFIAAWYQGKRIIPLLAVKGIILNSIQLRRMQRILGEDQGFDLSIALMHGSLDATRLTEMSESLMAGLRAAGALARVGLDPLAFEIDRTARVFPFPGLLSFGDEDADAAIFFGRSPEISRCIEELREMRAKGEYRPYAILGASGSGKSSLLKAGIIPRLRRERGWVALRVFRPGVDPLLAFTTSLACSLTGTGAFAAGAIRDTLRQTWQGVEKVDGLATTSALLSLLAPLEHYFAEIRRRLGRPDGLVLIAVDQAEELLQQDCESADILCDYIRAAIGISTEGQTLASHQSSRSLVALTIRTDRFYELQKMPRLCGLDARCADVRPLPAHRLVEVIECPAKRYGVEVDPALIDQLISDAPGEDALPLLAFALQHIWQQYRPENRLQVTLAEDSRTLHNLMENCAERALRGFTPADQTSAIGPVPDETVDLVSRVFVPPLAQISEAGSAVRRVVPMSRFNGRALDVLERFVAWRLLTRKNGANGAESTIEIAHEALFRAWPRLQRWIDKEKGLLQALSDLQTSATAWDSHEHKSQYVDHRGARLRLALSLTAHEDFGREVSDIDRAYLDRASALQRRRRIAFVGTLSLAVLIGLAIIEWFTEGAMRATMQEIAILNVRSGRPITGGVYAIAGAPSPGDLSRLAPTGNADRVIWETGLPLKLLVDVRHDYAASEFHLTADGGRLITQSYGGESGAIWDVVTGTVLEEIHGSGNISTYFYSDDDTRLLVRFNDSSMGLWNVTTGEQISEWPPGTVQESGTLLNSKVHRFVTVSASWSTTLWSLVDGAKVADLGKPNDTLYIVMSKDVPRAVLATRSTRLELWDTEYGQKISDVSDTSQPRSQLFAETGYIGLFLDPSGKSVTTFDSLTGRRLATIRVTSPLVGSTLTADGSRLVSRTANKLLYLWNARTGDRIADLGQVAAGEDYGVLPSTGRTIIIRSPDDSAELRSTNDGAVLRRFDRGDVHSFKFSKRGDRVVTVSVNRSATLWNAATGTLLTSVGGPGTVDHTTFDLDGTILSIGSHTSLGGLWNAVLGKKITDYRRPYEDESGAFAKDGKRYVTSSELNFGALWDTESGRFLAEVGGQGANESASISQDGRRVGINSTTDSIAIFGIDDVPINLSGSSLRERVCAVNRAAVGAFPVGVRQGSEKEGSRLTGYLQGRPWHPCDWRGLATLDGWKQQLRRWGVKMGLTDDYVCGVTGSGAISSTAEIECKDLATAKSRPTQRSVSRAKD